MKQENVSRETYLRKYGSLCLACPRRVLGVSREGGGIKRARRLVYAHPDLDALLVSRLREVPSPIFLHGRRFERRGDTGTLFSFLCAPPLDIVHTFRHTALLRVISRLKSRSIDKITVFSYTLVGKIFGEGVLQCLYVTRS